MPCPGIETRRGTVFRNLVFGFLQKRTNSPSVEKMSLGGDPDYRGKMKLSSPKKSQPYVLLSSLIRIDGLESTNAEATAGPIYLCLRPPYPVGFPVAGRRATGYLPPKPNLRIEKGQTDVNDP